MDKDIEYPPSHTVPAQPDPAMQFTYLAEPARQAPAVVPALQGPGRHGSNRVPAPTDGDNRFKAVQQKLKAFSGALDGATGRLEALRRRMRATADRASTLAGHIADADLDPVFVEMTNAVATALDGAALATGRLHESAQAVSADASDTQRTHARMYEALDQIRSGRKHRTPKPGFFARN
ncbi:conjugal transfer protein TraB [Kitasatospora sp. NPDC093679]|uniref:conjugal transfer protein TraB n=1 Tax=Kitasatospora sp. NPDC093679 TaxID=3154983 RepID=UPI003440FE76